jgi:nitrous oxidase accessory protein
VFRDNMIQVRVDGGDHARNITWTNNDFDDYRGYDLDGDGIGDVPYELRSLSSQLTGRFPDLEFFRGTPAFAAIDIASHVMPLFRTSTVLVDETPSMRGIAEETTRAR